MFSDHHVPISGSHHHSTLSFCSTKRSPESQKPLIGGLLGRAASMCDVLVLICLVQEAPPIVWKAPESQLEWSFQIISQTSHIGNSSFSRVKPAFSNAPRLSWGLRVQEIWRSQEDEKFSATEPRALYGFSDKVRNLSVKFGKPAKPWFFLGFRQTSRGRWQIYRSQTRSTQWIPPALALALQRVHGSPRSFAEKAQSAGVRGSVPQRSVSVGAKTQWVKKHQWIAMERDFSVIHVSSTSYVRVLPPKFQTALVRHSQTLDVFDDPPKKAILMGNWW